MEELLKKQLLFQKVIIGFLGGIFVIALYCAVTLVPNAVSVMQKAEQTLESAETTMKLAETAISGIEGRMKELDILVENSRKSLETATAKLESLDIETLNQAIRELEAVVKPLAKFMGYK